MFCIGVKGKNRFCLKTPEEFTVHNPQIYLGVI